MTDIQNSSSCARCGGAGGWQWIYCAECGNYIGWRHAEASHPDASQKLTGPIITDCGHEVFGEPGFLSCPDCHDSENRGQQIISGTFT